MLRKQVPAGLNFSLTGNPNFNTDIGGFFCNAYNVMGPGSAPKNPQYQELYVRWMQYGLFCPVFRSHGADAPREIWQFGEKGTPVYRQYNPYAFSCNHNYTVSKEENDYLVSVGWTEEGIAWYGIAQYEEGIAWYGIVQ